MFNDLIDGSVVIIIIVICIIVGGIAMTAVWKVPDQIVQNSEYAPLQATYPIGKGMINTASDGKDIWDLVKAISLLVGLPIGGYVVIRVVKEL
ncbi:MAG: hypothetical protein HY223_05345 [Thaumarchaeota archaeon]|nr:hypothetical protein [Nitrososphaerota archaeon]